MTQARHTPAARPADRLDGLAFDARYISAEPSGIGQVCLELLRGLACLDERPPLHVLVNQDTFIPDDVKVREHITLARVPWVPYGVSNQVFLPGHLRRHGVRLLHSVDSYNPLLAFGVQVIVNVHDLIPLTCTVGMARSTKARYRRTWKTWLKLQCGRARRVVSGSRHAAADIARLLGVDPAKLAVIPNPIREWTATEPPERLRRRLGLAGRVISYVGRQEPYKNVITLIRALPILNRLLDGPRVRLVVAGNLDDRYPEPRREAERLGLGDQVVFPGFLREPSLGALYRLSDVFVFPSLYEGFGMPPLEAMRFGTPVVAGRHASLPEVLGDAALFVDTKDPHAVARGVASILRDPQLAHRLRQAGFRQVQQFSRQEAAREYYQLYREVLLGAEAVRPPRPATPRPAPVALRGVAGVVRRECA